MSKLVKSASKKLGVLFRCKHFNSAQLCKLYTGFIRPCLEYCSYIWGSSPYTSLFDRVESKAICLIGDPSLTLTLDPLSLRRKVVSLILFYRYYFGHCFDELAACIPPPMAQPHSTGQASFAHNYCVELSNARINRFNGGFFLSTSRLWNSLPSSLFPASFKRQVYHHLRNQMAWFFFVALFRYFVNLFYYFNCLSFPFCKGYRIEKGHIVPVLPVFPFITLSLSLSLSLSPLSLSLSPPSLSLSLSPPPSPLPPFLFPPPPSLFPPSVMSVKHFQFVCALGV